MFTKPEDMLHLKFAVENAKRNKICGALVHLNCIPL